MTCSAQGWSGWSWKWTPALYVQGTYSPDVKECWGQLPLLAQSVGCFWGLWSVFWFPVCYWPASVRAPKGRTHGSCSTEKYLWASQEPWFMAFYPCLPSILSPAATGSSNCATGPVDSSGAIAMGSVQLSSRKNPPRLGFPTIPAWSSPFILIRPLCQVEPDLKIFLRLEIIFIRCHLGHLHFL